jgi:hypothetical protein
MSWYEYHNKSEELAMLAELELKQSHHAQARELYSQAADAEAFALAEVDRTKVRTLSVTVVSAVSLYYKAGDLKKAKDVAATWLDTHLLLPFAEDQIEELVSLIEEARGDHNRSFQPLAANKRSKPRGIGLVPRMIPTFPKLLFTIFVVALLCFGSYVYGTSKWKQSATNHAWAPLARSGERTSVIVLDDQKSPSFAISILSTELKWRFNSSSSVELNGTPIDLTSFVDQLNLSAAKAVVCVGSASSSGLKDSNDLLALARANYLATTIRQRVGSSVPVYRLNLGQFQGEPETDSRRVFIIEVINLREGTDLSEAIRAALSGKLNQNPFLDLTKYSRFELQ